MKRYKWISFVWLLFLCFTGAASSAKAQTSKEGVGIFQLIDSLHRYVSDLVNLDQSENAAFNLPVGIKFDVGNTPVSLAVAKIKFGTDYGEATLYAKLETPQEGKSLIFGATGIKISNSGNLIGDVHLALLSNVTISLGSLGKVTLKGSMDSTGHASSNTYIALDCTGAVQDISLNAEITLNPNTFVLPDKVSPVTAPFKIDIADWNDLLVQVEFPTFEIKGLDGFMFTLEKAALDLSDLQNPDNFAPDMQYMSKYFHLPDVDLWRGVYVDKFKLTFPSWFKNKHADTPITIEADKLLIDENGITGSISGSNILSLENGDADGWSFSVNSFNLSLLANNISAFGFGGQIDIPLSEKVQPLDYKAYISKDDYAMKVSMRDSLDFSIFGTAKLKIDPTSYVTLELKDGKFVPRAVFNGDMSLDADGLKIEDLAFKKLALSPEGMSVESIAYGGQVSFYNFPVSLSDIHFALQDNVADLNFRMKLDLMKEKISAGGGLDMRSKHEGRRWDFQGVSVDALKLDSVSLSGFRLSGELAIKKADPVFGNYVGGHINMALDVLSSGLSVDVAAVFGNAGYRYWFVNGEVDLGAGISVGAVKITGFSGGAYYRMQPTGDKGLAAFKPDKGISLGFRAGVSLAIASKEAVSAKAIYEMNFNASGGINTILFYGQAAFMTDLTPLQDKLAPIRNFYNGVQKTFKAADKSLSDQIKAQSDSELVQKLIGKVSANTNLPPLSNSGVITAYVRIEYEAETKTFDANFSINLSVPGNFIRGEGNNGAALWANLHISPATWYIRIGTPTNPIGIAIGIKGLPSIHSDAYFMLGDDILPPAPLPDLVRNKLGGDIDQHPYSDNLMSIGSGIGFGARFGFDTGDLTFLILYCRFQAEMGFDFTLTDMSGYACEGSTKQIGMNGWRAEGRCYAALDGDLGVKLNLLFIHKKISVIHGGVAAALEAKLPNPTWIGGALGIDLNILGLIKAKMSMKFSFGENCKLVRLDGTVPPLDFSLISDASPTDGSTDVDVFTSPQVTFAKAVNASFSLYNEDANGNKTYEDEGKKSYRIRLGNCYLENLSNGQELPLDKPLNQLLSNDKLALTLKTRDILPSHTKIQLSVTVYLEELQANGWTAVDGGTETKTLTFTSGEQPDHIPLENVLSSYPLINQQNFYRSEGKVNGSIRGYIALSYGQPDLFANNFDKKVRFTANGSTRSVDFHYNAANKSVEYEIPALSGNCAYTVDFGLYGKASSNTGGLQQTSYTQSYDNGQGETFDVEFIKNLAQKVLASGSKSIFNYGFHSSRYSTFAGKINGLALETGNDNIFGMTDVRRLLLFSSKAIDEPFDLAEVVGNSYTYGKPLVSIEALMTDKYYTEDIAPLIYEPLPSYQFTRDIARQLGIAYLRIPSNAFVLYEGYVDALNNGNTPSRYGIFPYVHVLQRMYYADFYELKDQLSPYGRLAQQREKFKKLWSTGAFPFYREGRIYPAQLIYRLPDGREGSAVKVKYEWRWKY